MARSSRIFVWLAVAGFCALSADATVNAALAGSVDIDSTARGYFRETGIGTAARAVDATTAGQSGFSNREYRAYYVFDLSGFAETATSVTLRVRTEPDANGYTSVDPFETIAALSFGGTSTDLFGPEPTPTAASALFTQLGAGSVYDTIDFTIADRGKVFEFDILASDVNAASGGLFTVALVNTTLSPATSEEYVNFGVGNFNSSNPPDHALSIQFTSVPEPSSAALLGLGLAGLALKRRRQRGV